LGNLIFNYLKEGALNGYKCSECKRTINNAKTTSKITSTPEPYVAKTSIKHTSK